jgi:hypothetical protein
MRFAQVVAVALLLAAGCSQGTTDSADPASASNGTAATPEGATKVVFHVEGMH